MDNSPRLPTVSILIGAGLAAVTALLATADEPQPVFVLSELQIGLAAIALTLAIFGAQGLVSVALEGRRLRPGRIPPRLTNPLTAAIIVLVIALLANALWLAATLVSEAGPTQVGIAAGLGFLALALLLIAYKEAFVGDEARFDRRDDGVPW